MADNHSFDIVSEVDFQELSNALNQTEKEVSQRFDLKDSKTTLEFNPTEKQIHINSQDEYKLKAVYEILKAKLVKRNISLKALDPGKIESALGGRAKQDIKILQGLDKEKAKLINSDIKESKLKVQSQIQDEKIRVSSQKIDFLQSLISLLKSKEYNFPIQFTNYR